MFRWPLPPMWLHNRTLQSVALFSDNRSLWNHWTFSIIWAAPGKPIHYFEEPHTRSHTCKNIWSMRYNESTWLFWMHHCFQRVALRNWSVYMDTSQERLAVLYFSRIKLFSLKIRALQVRRNWGEVSFCIKLATWIWVSAAMHRPDVAASRYFELLPFYLAIDFSVLSSGECT